MVFQSLDGPAPAANQTKTPLSFPPPSSRPIPNQLFLPRHAKILPTSTCPEYASVSVPELESECAFAHEILWNHFGYIPCYQGLDQDTYKQRSPPPPPTLSPALPQDTQYASSQSHLRSRTSSSVSLPNMAKKRRSLSSILVPSFIPQPTASTSAHFTSPPPDGTTRSHTVTSSSTELIPIDDTSDWLSFYSGTTSPTRSEFSIGPVTPSRNSPPPDLLDNDPFANLAPAPALRASRATSPVRTIFDNFPDELSLPATPSSPLSQSALAQEGEDGTRTSRPPRASRSLKSFHDHPSMTQASQMEGTRPSLPRRPKSSGPPQVRPAYTRPAFSPRPSLPSLNILAQKSVPLPKVRRGRPGAHLPLEPWEDSETSAYSEPPSPTRLVGFSTSPAVRRRTHLRCPTLSMIRDSRMYLDGESADGDITPQEAPDAKEDAPGLARDLLEGHRTTSASSLSVEREQGAELHESLDDLDDQNRAPTTPPKSPSLILHARSTSGTSTESTVPSLCPSSPSSSSSGCHSPTCTHFSPPHPHVHVDDSSGHPGYPDQFAHHRTTQFLTSDLVSTLGYNYSDALAHLSNCSSASSPSSLFPSGDFEPGSSAGTIKAVVPPSPRSPVDSESEDDTVMRRIGSENRWSTEAIEFHHRISTFNHSLTSFPLFEPQNPSFDSIQDSSAICSPALSRSLSSRSSSTISSEYDYGDEDSGYYSYDLGSFQDPHSPSASQQQRPVAGYGIPWPSTRRASGSPDASIHNVLEDLEDLAEDLTERFSLSRSSTDSVRSYPCPGDGDVFGGSELTDAAGGDSSSNRSRRPGGGSPAGGSSSVGMGGHHPSNGRSRYCGHGEGDGEDSDDDKRRRPHRLPISYQAVATDIDTDSEDSGTDDYGEDSPSAKRTRVRHDTVRTGICSPIPPMYGPPASTGNDTTEDPPASTGNDTTDDDVPLAQQIPGALKAQRTIRRQVRDELDEKREQRRAKRALLQQRSEEHRTRAVSSTAESTVPTQPSSPIKGRPRTKTLPSSINRPFHADDLTKKLLGLHTGSSPSDGDALPTSPSPVPRSKRPSLDTVEQSYPRGRAITADSQPDSTSASRQTSRPPVQESSRSLRPSRSFHNQRTAESELAPPLPIPGRTSPISRMQRAMSRRRPAVEEPTTFLPLDRARSVKVTKSARLSIERTAPESASVAPRAGSAAVSSPSTISQSAKVQAGWQQRVFIGNMQRFCLVEIEPTTSAGHVLNMLNGEGILEEVPNGESDWMLWEVSQDFGMERPIRNFEMLDDVCGAWDINTTVNLLVIKVTQLAPLLSQQALPSASPICSGYVQWEYKRGKWQKRWMELREHSLWLSKRDNGKDATFLCSLNNFDAYYVTRGHKAPKPYVFAVKSTDSLSYFESTSDYVHVFSCGESEGKNWLKEILLARSYVSVQERNVVSVSAGGLQRSTTSASRKRTPAQPLVTIGPHKSDMTAPPTFEPINGSLLARR